MRDLYDLIHVYNHYDKASLKEIARQNTLEGSFIEGLVKKKFQNDRSAMNYLFGETDGLVKYRMLKSRVRDKLFIGICNRFFEGKSNDEIDAYKAFLFFKEIYSQGYNNLVLYHLNRYIKRNSINDKRLKIKLFDLLIQIKHDSGEVELDSQKIKETIRIKELLNLERMVFKKFNEYMINRNNYTQKYKITVLTILMSSIEENCRIAESEYLTIALRCLNIAYYFELGEYEKITTKLREYDLLKYSPYHTGLSINYKILCFLFYGESLIRLNHDLTAGEVLKEYSCDKLNESIFDFELIELQIIVLIRQKEYKLGYEYIKKFWKREKCKNDQEKVDKISIIAAAIEILINIKIRRSFLRKKIRFLSGAKNVKFYFDYKALFMLINLIVKCNDSSVSISRKDQIKLRNDILEFRSYSKNNFSPFKAIIVDLYNEIPLNDF